MEGTKYTTEEAILKRAKEAINIPLYKIDKTGRLKTGKGAIGSVIEESWFEYKPNSESEPDFSEAGVELKVTPYIFNKNGERRAKERLVCNIINYMEEYKLTFTSSSFWHKCHRMLLMSYEHKFNLPKNKYMIDAAILFSFPAQDLAIIRCDWIKIINKIKEGKAHEISEGDTIYLAACTKGANSSSTRKQPFSNILAKQRAYSLKVSYMTQVLNNYIFGETKNPQIIKDSNDLDECDFETYIINKIKRYYGKTINELKSIFNLTSNAKNINNLILAKMLGVTGNIANTDEFKKSGIIPKTIRVDENGHIKEHMSFPAFDFIRLSKETVWEESELYNYLAPTKFMFVIFSKRNDEKYEFSRVKFWNIPNNDLDEVKKVWNRTVRTIRKGVKLVKTSRGVSNNLPKQSESNVAHVRPHAKDGLDKLPLPNGRMMTKQCFWLNNSYIEKQIN